MAKSVTRSDSITVSRHELAARAALARALRSRLSVDQEKSPRVPRSKIVRALGLDTAKIAKIRKEEGVAYKRDVARIRESFLTPRAVKAATAKSRRNIDRVISANNSSPPSSNLKTLVPREMRFLALEGTALPSSFGNQVVNFVNPGQANFHLKVEEFDDGDADTKSVIASWYFDFIPWEEGQYRINALMWANGNYVVKSDDGWPESREASLKIDLSAIIWGAPAPGPDVTQDELDFDPSEHLEVFELADDNINASGHMNEVFSFSEVYPYPLPKDRPVQLVICLTFVAYVKGADTTSEFNCLGAGDGVGCPFVTMEKL